MIVSDSNGDFVPINIEDIAQVVEVDEDGSTHRTCLKENSTDPLLGNITYVLLILRINNMARFRCNYSLIYLTLTKNNFHRHCSHESTTEHNGPEI